LLQSLVVLRCHGLVRLTYSGPTRRWQNAALESPPKLATGWPQEHYPIAGSEFKLQWGSGPRFYTARRVLSNVITNGVFRQRV
jgi:hypothetical protein